MAVRLLLASQSPRRRELLGLLNVQFFVVPSDYDEKMDHTLSPEHLVEQNALGKALAVQGQYTNELILGADTVVVHNGRVLGKPADRADAERMLTALQGQWHTVYTGIALVRDRQWRVRHRTTRVHMRPLAPAQVTSYVASGEPMDKAGAYAIQGIGAAFVDAIEGCYTNVVGLSLPLLADMLAEFELTIL
jgi:septum formation protein